MTATTMKKVCTVDDYVHISARSDGSVNVSLILEKLGGGGHFNVAGAQLKNTTVKDAISLLKKAIIECENPD